MVATYSSLGEDLLNLCIVAGPKDCAAIRRAYLRNNLHYLEASLSRYAERDKNWDWESRLCRDRYLAWTEVNTDWRRLVTEERITVWPGPPKRTQKTKRIVCMLSSTRQSLW